MASAAKRPRREKTGAYKKVETREEIIFRNSKGNQKILYVVARRNCEGDGVNLQSLSEKLKSQDIPFSAMEHPALHEYKRYEAARKHREDVLAGRVERRPWDPRDLPEPPLVPRPEHSIIALRIIPPHPHKILNVSMTIRGAMRACSFTAIADCTAALDWLSGLVNDLRCDVPDRLAMLRVNSFMNRLNIADDDMEEEEDEEA